MTDLMASTSGLEQRLTEVQTELGQVKQQITQAIGHLTAGTATSPDFFQPGRIYASRDIDIQFRCEHLSTQPKTGELIAWGWFTLNVRDPHWTGREMRRKDFSGWTDITGDLT